MLDARSPVDHPEMRDPVREVELVDRVQLPGRRGNRRRGRYIFGIRTEQGDYAFTKFFRSPEPLPRP